MKARLFHGMILMMVWLCAAGLVTPAASARGAARQTASAQVAKGGLRGQVTDPSGATVGGAAVLLTTPDGQAVDTTTNKDGFFEFKDLAPGKYSVKVIADGFSPFLQ